MTEEVRLHRRLSLPLLTLYGLGTILGAGIYVLVGKVAGASGFYAPLSFLIAALIASLTAFSYASLSSRFPSSAGEARYVRQAFRSPLFSGLVGWLIVSIGVISAATMFKGFAGYLHVFIQFDDWLVITLLVFMFSALAIWGILESVSMASLITIIEIAGLLLVIGMNQQALSTPGELFSHWGGFDKVAIWNGILLGSILAFYAFLGFEDIVNVAEEVREPERDLPRAIYIALIVSSFLYILVSIVAVQGLPLDQLASSKAPLADLLSDYAWSRNTISLISLMAVSNGALIQIIMASRVVYGMARLGNAPANFSVIHYRTHTPVRATLLVSALVLVFSLFLPLLTLAQITSTITLFVFAMVNLALLKVNLDDRKTRQISFTNYLIPFFGAIICLFLFAYQLFLGF
jgi:amino acid transporter